MDINSLLSPSDPPLRKNSPTPNGSVAKRQRKSQASISAPKSGTSHNVQTAAPLVPVQQDARMSVSSPAINGASHATGIGAQNTPSADGVRLQRQSSTSGMDTLADLASMQHHQQTARTNAGGLKSMEIFDNQLSSSSNLPNLPCLSRKVSGSQNSVDVNMTDAATSTPHRTFKASSLSESELHTVAQLMTSIAENPYAYEFHVQLVKLLHQGLVTHVWPSGMEGARGDPRTYDLLLDLQQATETTDARFALGEDLWVDRLQDQILLADTLEDCLAVMETCQKAVSEETGSCKLWLIYGNWVLTLYNMAHPSEPIILSGEKTLYHQESWSEEDKTIASEALSQTQVMDVWKQGMRETMHRMNDSHVIWDRYTDLLQQELSTFPSQNSISSVRTHLTERLQIPHAKWSDTFQVFSNFTSTYDNATYEEVMVSTNRKTADIRDIYGKREIFESKLQHAVNSGDTNTEWSIFNDYLEWEASQNRKKKASSFTLLNALYERALLRFPTLTDLWEDYLMILASEPDQNRAIIPSLSVLERATRHCPWSGTLWSQYLVAAERANQLFTETGEIKHKATSSGLLDAGGMEEVLKVHSAWCGFLRRRAFQKDSTDEELDVAEVGIRSAIEDMETLGRQKYGPEYKGDPQYRLERIYVTFLSQSGKWQAARATWKNLVARHGDSYEFWLSYYNWEMITWGTLDHDDHGRQKFPPHEATKILHQALKRPKIDWPEKIMEMCRQHCVDHENVEKLEASTVENRKVMKIVARRRQKEALEAAELVRQQQNIAESGTDTVTTRTGTKRKRDSHDVGDEAVTDQSRPDPGKTPDVAAVDQPSEASTVKRDRENASIMVHNLPLGTTETRVRQFFRDCGTINSLKLLSEDGTSITATIEFDSKLDVLTAQTKDMKSLDGNVIEVQVGNGSTLFVTNFPPTADETYIRHLFDKYGEIVDVRFPSLKYNTHRRFCYVQFRSSTQAQSATELNERALEGNFKLVAKISDPGRKHDRSGPLHEAREVYVANLDWSATDGEVQEVFSKYGTVERVRIPKNVAGKSKGIAFVVFSKKEEATAALQLNLTKFKSRLLNVSLSTNNPAKRQSTTVITSNPRSSLSSSPQPEHEVATSTLNRDTKSSLPTVSASPPSQSESVPKPSRDEIASRTLALLNVPDTVNDTRIRALVEPYGPLTKIILRPDHQGAIIEFQDVASMGKASLGLDGYEIAVGRALRIGTVAEMMKEKAEWRSDKITTTRTSAGIGDREKDRHVAQSLHVGSVIRRPGAQSGRRGGKGGLGLKHSGGGLGGLRAMGSGGTEGRNDTAEVSVKDDKGGGEGVMGKAKSNADFKAMFLGGAVSNPQ